MSFRKLSSTELCPAYFCLWSTKHWVWRFIHLDSFPVCISFHTDVISAVCGHGEALGHPSTLLKVNEGVLLWHVMIVYGEPRVYEYTLKIEVSCNFPASVVFTLGTNTWLWRNVRFSGLRASVVVVVTFYSEDWNINNNFYLKNKYKFIDFVLCFLGKFRRVNWKGVQPKKTKRDACFEERFVSKQRF